METFSAALFSLALRTCPRAFREQYASSMRADLAQTMREHASPIAKLWYAILACFDVIGSAAVERTSDLASDVRATGRSFCKSPLFACTVIGTLAIAIGANTAVFSILRGVVLAPLPFPQSDRIVTITGKYAASPMLGISIPDFDDARAAATTLAASGLVTQPLGSARIGGKLFAIDEGQVTAGFFDVFGIPPLFGRYLTPHDAHPGAQRVAVLTEQFWRKHLGADAGIVGKSIEIDDRAVIVVGIAPARFSPSDVGETGGDLWLAQPSTNAGHPFLRRSHSYSAVARLKAGVSIDAARAELARIFARLGKRYPSEDRDFTLMMAPLLDEVVGDIRPTLFAVFAAVCGVLLVACANVANLLLGRGSARERDLVVRLALGASRRRIVAQILTEILAYAMIGAVLGVAIAWFAVRAFVASAPVDIPRLDNISIDGATLSYTIAIAILTAIAAGLAPAVAFSRRDLTTVLQTAGRSGDSTRGGRYRASLVVFEVACTLAIVVAAGLSVRSFEGLMGRPLGFDSSDVTVASRINVMAGPSQEATRSKFFSEALERARAIPGVIDAAWTSSIPFTDVQVIMGMEIVGRAGEMPQPIQLVGPDFFRVMRTRVLAGRVFTDRDRENTAPVAIVNEAFAQHYFRGRSPIGARLAFNKSTPPAVVGIVDTIRPSYAASEKPIVYLPFYRLMVPLATLAVRTRPGADVSSALADLVPSVNAELVRPEVDSLPDLASQNVSRARLTLQTLAFLATVAFSLAVAGIYAIVSYGVSQRTREFGIRMALGAQTSTIRRGVVGRAMRVAAVGIALGVLLAALVTHSLADALYDIAPLDPLTFAAVIVIIAIAALVAALVPAWRATRVDPAIALRYE